jgi:error-prone DNA polymerase
VSSSGRFLAAILNAQPMGFYAPAQLVRDAREHGVEVRPVDVNLSEWDCTLETTAGERRAVRVGFCMVRSLNKKDAEELVDRRTLWAARPSPSLASKMYGGAHWCR